MSRSSIRVIGAVFCLGTAGCSQMQFTPNPSLGAKSGVQVLYGYPHGNYHSVGVIDFDYYRPGFRVPTVSDALPNLKAKVQQAGGNALIVRNQRIGNHNNRLITISAEVLSVPRSHNGSP